ncbi:hypothetical protein BDZ89DRAFT_1060368 [Hymenopellis radicata]|nr:hypothetical protein BDZ89DRAFT_1060368 [Hymenopellis radicata]
MAANQSSDEEEWPYLKLTPIREEEDGSNNYNEFKQRSILDLDAAGYWRYVDGPDYDPPVIPELRPSLQVQALDSAGTSTTITVPGNEADVAAAKKQAEPWLSADKKAHAIIVRAVPAEKLYVVWGCKSAHDTWRALKDEYEFTNVFTAVMIQQLLVGYQCGEDEDPVRWRQVMVQLYQRLCDVDPNVMPDTLFAQHLLLSSAAVLERLKHEEVHLKIDPFIVSVNALVAGKGKRRPTIAGVGSSSIHCQKTDKAQQRRRNRRPAPYKQPVKYCLKIRVFFWKNKKHAATQGRRKQAFTNDS